MLPVSASGRFGALNLSVAWAGDGWPADVRAVLERLGDTGPQELVIAARRLSPGAIELLTRHGANWVDETGAARLVGPGVLVIRDGSGEPAQERAFTWSASAIAAGEALLARDWAEGIGTGELATLLRWSPSQISHVLQSFDGEGWTVKYGPLRGRGARRELVAASDLLERWAEAVSTEDREERQAHRVLRSPLGFLEAELAPALDESTRWALSGWAAAHELAPFASQVPSLQIYVHEDDFERALDRAIRSAGLKDVAEGGKVTFVAAHPSVLALAQPTEVGPVASTPRVYADLLAMGGRGHDVADHLREELMGGKAGGPGRNPPRALASWERACRERLAGLAAETPELADAYGRGAWSATYGLAGLSQRQSPRDLLAMLREVAGRETGWPAWWVPDRDGARPVPREGAVECWISDSVFGDTAHADYWKADPSGRLCLIRGYQEDSAMEELAPEPGTRLDLTLPIWRTGECLMHAERLASRLEASTIQFMMRWTGLEGRSLAALAARDRHLTPTRPCRQREVISFVEVAPAQVRTEPADLVRELVSPLFECFDFFEPPPSIYAEELERMRG